MYGDLNTLSSWGGIDSAYETYVAYNWEPDKTDNNRGGAPTYGFRNNLATCPDYYYRYNDPEMAGKILALRVYLRSAKLYPAMLNSKVDNDPSTIPWYSDPEIKSMTDDNLKDGLRFTMGLYDYATREDEVIVPTWWGAWAGTGSSVPNPIPPDPSSKIMEYYPKYPDSPEGNDPVWNVPPNPVP